MKTEDVAHKWLTDHFPYERFDSTHVASLTKLLRSVQPRKRRSPKKSR